MGRNVGLKVGGKRWTNVFGICGANSQKDYEATNNKLKKTSRALKL